MNKKIMRILTGVLLSWCILVSAVLLTIRMLEPDLPWEQEPYSAQNNGPTIIAQGPETAGPETKESETEEAELPEPEPEEAEAAEPEAPETEQIESQTEENGEDGATVTEQAALLVERNILENLPAEQVFPELSQYSLVLIGDSRVVGFSLYGFVRERYVLASNGATIDDLQHHIREAAAAAPDYIFVAYGINDIKERIGRTPEGYASYVENKIRNLADAVPDAVIFVQSIIPARPFLTSSVPAYGEVDAYNEALREMSASNGWGFVDNSEIAEEHAGLYANDGIHLGADFYKHWGRNLLLAIFDEENGLQDRQ